eukprot:1336827-Prymnesium_polylepis.1
MFKTVREGASPPTAVCRPAAASPAAKWPPACCQEQGTENQPRDGTKPPLKGGAWQGSRPGVRASGAGSRASAARRETIDACVRKFNRWSRCAGRGRGARALHCNLDVTSRGALPCSARALLTEASAELLAAHSPPHDVCAANSWARAAAAFEQDSAPQM